MCLQKFPNMTFPHCVFSASPLWLCWAKKADLRSEIFHPPSSLLSARSRAEGWGHFLSSFEEGGKCCEWKTPAPISSYSSSARFTNVMQELQLNWANVCVCVGMEGVFLTCIGSGRPVSRWEDYRRKHTWQRILPKWSMTEGYVWQLIPIIQSFFYTGNFLQKSAECRVQWRRNLRKSWNRPEILILHKLSGKVLSPWKLTTEDKSQTLIDLESRDFKILHPHTSPPRILENWQNWQISHMIDAVYFVEHGITQNKGWTMYKNNFEWKLWPSP